MPQRGLRGRGAISHWIVDPAARTLEQLRLQGDKYLIASVAGMDDLFAPDSFDGLEIPLAELWTIPEEPKD
jgi:Uma2 family endonuclease